MMNSAVSGMQLAWQTLTIWVMGICLLALAVAVVVLARKLKKSRLDLCVCNAHKAVPSDVIEAETAMIEQIEQGFKNDEFKMYLQFIVDNHTKCVTSAEVLSRWESAEGIVPPMRFIPVMEKYGLIARLDYLMFEKACAKLSAWRGTEFEAMNISCNFTRITISETDFVEKIKTIADKYEFDPKKLYIEITEDAIEMNLDAAMHNIRQTKEFGFQVALDDIGSGYTSLINLCEYPLDIVKVDRDILLRATNNRGKKLFLSIVMLAHNLNLKVVCEGVETEEQNTFVTESGCDYIQGWYYFKAMPEDKAEACARTYMLSIKPEGDR